MRRAPRFNAIPQRGYHNHSLIRPSHTLDSNDLSPSESWQVAPVLLYNLTWRFELMSCVSETYFAFATFGESKSQQKTEGQSQENVIAVMLRNTSSCIQKLDPKGRIGLLGIDRA